MIDKPHGCIQYKATSSALKKTHALFRKLFLTLQKELCCIKLSVPVLVTLLDKLPNFEIRKYLAKSNVCANIPGIEFGRTCSNEMDRTRCGVIVNHARPIRFGLRKNFSFRHKAMRGGTTVSPSFCRHCIVLL